jgi:hypothetical protein
LREAKTEIRQTHFYPTIAGWPVPIQTGSNEPRRESSIMGASEWMSFAPYQPDMNKVIQDLREDAFRNGKYYNFAEYALKQLRDLDYEDYNPYEYHPRYRLTKAELERLKILSQPETLEDLIKIQGDSGTHCIIDIDGISPTPQYRMATPVSEEQLVELFGTTKPTRTMVEMLKPHFKDLINEYWMAVCLVVYKNDEPDEVFIYGITGD